MNLKTRVGLLGGGLLLLLGSSWFIHRTVYGPPPFPPEAGALVRLTEGQVSLVEISSFGCPHCRRYARDSLPTALQVAREKQLAYVVRHIRVYEGDEMLAKAALCAYEIEGPELYLKVRKAIEMAYNRLLPGLTLQRLERELADAEAYPDSLTPCLRDPRPHPQVEKDTETARKLGVAATPTFFLGQRRLVGYPGREKFLRFIDE